MNHKTAFQIERIAFFSDAVFAIAITLMIVEIHPPVFPSDATQGQSVNQFLHLVPEIVALIGSFFLIGIYWRRHHQLFGFLTNYDSRLITLNMTVLLSVIFIPLSTGLIAANWEHFGISTRLFLPFVVYGFNYFVCAVFNYLLFRYALDPKNELVDLTEVHDPERLKLEVMFPIFVFLIVTIVSFFSGFLALPFFALFALEPIFINLTLRRKKNAA
ncbi:MAG: TMEM175 family protein [Acidobacteriota bacterium]